MTTKMGKQHGKNSNADGFWYCVFGIFSVYESYEGTFFLHGMLC